MANKNFEITEQDLRLINSKEGILELLKSKEIKIEKILNELQYQQEIEQLSEELVKMQDWLIHEKKKMLIIFEGRDAAGKGGAIKRFTEDLIPKYHRVVSLPKPSDIEKGQWYFQRYIQQLPTSSELVFFDRSWYNRAVVEPVNGFCTEIQHENFLKQVNELEKLLVEDGLIIFKFWLDISKEEQAERFNDRKNDPIKQWKIGPVDAKAQELWDTYTKYRDKMFKVSNSTHCPWIFVKANSKKSTRLETIRFVLNHVNYKNKNSDKINFIPDKNIIRYFSEWDNLNI